MTNCGNQCRVNYIMTYQWPQARSGFRGSVMKTIRSLVLATLGGALALAAGTRPGAQVPDTIRQYQFAASGDGYELVLREVPRPVAAPGEVLVRVRATSLNRRDWYMLNETIGERGLDYTGNVPLSDGAGDVVAVGEGVTEFQVGDRVAGTFFTDWVDGRRSDAVRPSARGAGPGTGGMLSEIVVTSPEGLVSIPGYLSYEEAATLPCAGVTAWNGLFKHGDLKPGEHVLLEGTGGVSSFGLLFAAAAGARPIITSSSNEKLARAAELGAVGTVNYRENEEWQVEVRALTNGAGVDHVLEIGGRDTLIKALEALSYEGHIALIGGVSGAAPPIPVGALMGKGAVATGIYVGSRADFEAMNAFMEEHEIRPVIDRVFAFEQAQEAYDLMGSGNFMGKIVVAL